jgi:hypothetical protein
MLPPVPLATAVATLPPLEPVTLVAVSPLAAVTPPAVDPPTKATPPVVASPTVVAAFANPPEPRPVEAVIAAPSVPTLVDVALVEVLEWLPTEGAALGPPPTLPVLAASSSAAPDEHAAHTPSKAALAIQRT